MKPIDRVRALLALGALSLVACSRAPASTQPGTATATSAFIDRLSFGRDIPTGGTVSDSAWLVFLDQVVTPRFPGGFGWQRTEGQWRYADGRIQRESGYALELYPGAVAMPDSTFEAIAREYMRRFNQEAVARSRIPVKSWMYWSVKPH